MDFRILGPVEVFSGGQQVQLSGQRQRALLAYLLVHANEAIPAEQLLDELWSEPPHGGLAALHTQISRLRKLVGDRIVSTGSAYAIRVEPGEFDLERFRAVLAEAGTTADPAKRSTALRAAEELWRGLPLGGLDAPFAAAEAAALEELRLAALEDRIEADLELGRDGKLVSELSALVARYPLRERLRAHQIVAHYRSGRQADALEAYRETRRILDEELGLEPSPALRELERAILRHDPALACPQPATTHAAGPRLRRRAPLVAAAVLTLGAATGAAVALTSSGRHARQATPPQQTPVASKAIAQPHRGSHKPRLKSRPHMAKTSSVTRGQTGPQPTHPTSRSIPPVERRTIPTATAHATTSNKKAPTAKTTTAKTTVTKTTVTTTTAATPRARKPSTPPLKPVTISDTFDGDQIDGTIWYQIREGSGWDLTQHDGHLEFIFPPATAPGPPYGNDGGHIGTQCKFPGDFDARVDFTLVQWPSANGIEVALWSFLGPTNIGWQSWRRSSPQWGEQYGSFTGPATSVALDDTSGTLRLARRNGVVTAYFLHKGSWQSLTSGRNTSLATIAIGANAGAGYDSPFGGQQVVVDFDNFSVTGNNPICPPGSQPSG